MKTKLQLTILTLSAMLLFFSGSVLGQNVKVLNLQDENHYFQVDDNASNDLDLGTDYTVEVWVYIKDTPHGNERIFYTNQWAMYIKSGTGSGGAVASVRVYGPAISAIDMDVPTEGWHHLCLQGNSAGGWTNNYIDGVAKLNAGATDFNATSYLRVGSYSLASTDFIGAIDEVRISTGNRYGRFGFTVSKDDIPYTDDANTILLFHFDNNTEFPPSNSSSKVFTITNHGVDASDYFDFDDPSFAETLPLPVEITKFEAVSNGDNVVLEWATATEVNNYGFEVERAVADNFETIGFVEGAGNSNSPKSYSFVDAAVSGEVSYRLKQIDTDGSFEYSDVVTVKANGLAKTELFQNHPNPFNPTTQISFSLSEMTNVKITVYNMLGQEVAELVNTEMASGVHSVKFDGSNLTSGFYIYRIETPNYSKTMKMLLVK